MMVVRLRELWVFWQKQGELIGRMRGRWYGGLSERIESPNFVGIAGFRF